MNTNQHLQNSSHAKLHLPPVSAASIPTSTSAPPTLPLFGNVMMSTPPECTGDILCVCPRCLIMKTSFFPKLPNFPTGTEMFGHSSMHLDSHNINQLLKLSHTQQQVAPASRITPPTSPTSSHSPNSVHNLPFSTANIMKR